MPKLTRFSLLFLLVLAGSIAAQTRVPPSTPPVQQPPAAGDDDVVRITTNLIQFDVTVTDKHGNPVPDLRPEDFEIQENDQKQKISNFSYISLAPNSAAEPAAPSGKNGPPIPPVHLRPEQVRRTIALVVDDLGLSFTSTAYVRQALKKYLDTQMEPGDLVAIIRTGGGMGALQQFTSDKRQLYATIDRIRWNPLGRGGVGIFGASEGAVDSVSTGDGSDNTVSPNFDENSFRDELFSVGTLGALNYIVRGLRELPGRKSVVLLSDGFRLFSSAGFPNDRTFEELRRLTDLANRASVVIYTLDARGLVNTGATAEDNVSGMTGPEMGNISSDRSKELSDTQTGLIYLAEQTGGFAVRGDNDLSDGIKRIVADQQGYYLIGYHPDDSTFDPRKLHYNSFKVKLKRPGLKVRYRNGFYGITDEKARESTPHTPEQQMAAALMSPFNAGDTQLQLTSLFGNDVRAGSFVRSFLHIRTQDLTFSDEPDGTHRASFDLMAVTFGDNGVPVDQINRTYTIHFPDETYRHALKAGFIYVATVPVKKPGAYQLRIAVRDVATNRIGSAGQFIEVPDIKKNRLILSGVAAFGVDPSLPKNGSAAPSQTTNTASPEDDPEAGVASRHFRPGMVLQYGCIIYNARLDKAAGQPALQTQVRLFRSGVEVYTGKSLPFSAKDQADLARLTLAGAIRLGTALMPGEYVLQVTVTDAATGEKPRTATQWIDFEIIAGPAAIN